MVGGFHSFSKLGLIELFGMDANQAAGLTIVVHAVQLVVTCLIGYAILWKEGLSLFQLRTTRGDDEAMRCPFCGHLESKVIDSRESKKGISIRRRRECLACERRFTTYEKIEEIPYMIVKKDGTRQLFDRPEAPRGMLKACEKRPIAVAKLEEIVEEIEAGSRSGRKRR